MDLEIRPHEGVGPVALGMTRDEVRAALAAVPGAMDRASSRGSLDYFFCNALQVEYAASGRASFIGVSWWPDVQTSFRLFGVNPWALPATELFKLLALADGGDHQFNGSEYLFRNLIVTVWDADSQYDHLGHERRPVYAQVGIGNTEYLQAIDAIR